MKINSVLIIDDEIDICLLLKNFLRKLQVCIFLRVCNKLIQNLNLIRQEEITQEIEIIMLSVEAITNEIRDEVPDKK